MQRNAEIEALISEMMRAMRTGDADAPRPACPRS
jgi:hypothetical protein